MMAILLIILVSLILVLVLDFITMFCGYPCLSFKEKGLAFLFFLCAGGIGRL